MGQTPTDEELFQMINDVDDNASGSIGMLIFFYSFLFTCSEKPFFIFSIRFYRVSQGRGETERTGS